MLLYRLLTHPVCEQVTLGVFIGNNQFCSVRTRVVTCTSTYNPLFPLHGTERLSCAYDKYCFL